MTRLYTELARGGVGLIVTGHIFVHPNGRASRAQTGLQTDDHARAWEPILKAVRAEAAVPVVAQLNYAGRQAWTRGVVATPNDKRDRLPPVGTTFNDFHERQIEHLVKAFVDAAQRAVQVGFDGVQLHMAHGYLLSESLSGATNKRADAWGGADPANRRRLALTVVDRVREALHGSAAVLAVKINGSDFLPPDGIEPAEAAETARLLATHGVQFIEVSSSMSGSLLGAAREVTTPETEGYLLPLAVEIGRAVDVPVASVAGYRTAPVMLKALGEGLDMISLSRPLVREPDWPRHLERDPSCAAKCISCNRCFAIRKGALRCMVDHPEPLE
jgi:2,4-dienoyl-CoA reductase-like NADH-dependent reductase (Old Yellow Enzyme family)